MLKPTVVRAESNSFLAVCDIGTRTRGQGVCDVSCQTWTRYYIQSRQGNQGESQLYTSWGNMHNRDVSIVHDGAEYQVGGEQG